LYPQHHNVPSARAAHAPFEVDTSAAIAFPGVAVESKVEMRGGANLEAVRELAGHSKLLTTQRYLHASGADLRDAVSRLPGNAKPLGN